MTKTDFQKRRESLGRVYFTKDTENAIVEYNETDDELLREKIFREKIHAPLDKLVENIINRFKFPYVDSNFEDIKAQVLSFLVLNLGKFTKGKGKAYSYFSVVAKNYLILHNNKAYKKQTRTTYLDDASLEDVGRVEEKLTTHQATELPRSDAQQFIDLTIQFWEFHMDRVFTKKRDIQIADAILELMRRAHNIENFNKKALYLLIREMTDAKTVYITRVLKIMREYAQEHMREFEATGHVADPAMYFSYNND